MGYKKTLQEYQKGGKWGEDKMWRSVEVLDDMILRKVEEEDPESYWEFMRDQHEIFCGPHFDERFARWEIAQMEHKDYRGNVHKGEHWGEGDARAVYDKHKAKLPAGTTVWDVAVALNANWHDKSELFGRWWPQGSEDKIIEDAMSFYFFDTDAPDGKIWRYMRAMRE